MDLMKLSKLLPYLCIVIFLSGCAELTGENKDDEEELVEVVPPTSVSVEFKQIERLARPAINEGLVRGNDNLNAFNSIPPTLDLATGNSAVLAVLVDASASLDLFDIIDGTDDHGDGFASEVVAGFLPDVLRIDTLASIPPGTAAYNGAFVVNDSGAPMLTGGRKIEDDVGDITLSYLVAGDVTALSGRAISDNTFYGGSAGNSAQGHKPLHGQTVPAAPDTITPGGAATFPFLAAPH